MVLNTKMPLIGEPRSSLDLLVEAGYPLMTSGQEHTVVIQPKQSAGRTSWDEIIHLRHHPGRALTVFSDTIEEAIEVLAYEFHLWEVRESLRSAKQALASSKTT